MEANQDYTLVYEGTADSSEETLRKLKSVFIADMSLDVPEVQRILSEIPSVIMKSSDPTSLTSYQQKLLGAGGRVMIVGPKENMPDLIDIPEASHEADDGFEFSLDLDLDDAAPLLSATQTDVKASAPTKVWELTPSDDSELSLSDDDEPLFEAKPEVKASPAKIEPQAIQPSQSPLELELSIADEPEESHVAAFINTSEEIGTQPDNELDLEIKPEVVAAPVVPVVPEMEPVIAQAPQSVPNPKTEIKIEIESPTVSAPELPTSALKTKPPVKPSPTIAISRDDYLAESDEESPEESEIEEIEDESTETDSPRSPFSTSLMLLLGATILVAGNYMFFSNAEPESDIAISELLAPAPSEQTRKRSKVKDAAAPAPVVPRSYSGEKNEGGYQFKASCDGSIGAIDRCSLSLETPEPPELTKEEYVAKKTRIWLSRIEAEKVPLTRTGDLKFYGESPAKIYVDLNGARERSIGNIAITATIDPADQESVLLSMKATERSQSIEQSVIIRGIETKGTDEK